MLEDPVHGRTAKFFTLQWHLTHACDMHCKHCYDRSKLSALDLGQAMAVLDQLEAFCQSRDVTGHACLSGGNPFFYPHFFELYESAARRGLRLSILGNPVAPEQLDRLIAIEKPRYFQVSLEGLEPHNDAIRGAGAYRRALDFLPLLRERGIQSAIMLTLTKDNMDQVLPLAEILRERVDRFTFNRLAAVGEGASLLVPDREPYGRFMVDYMAAARDNPILSFKDNLFNIFRKELGLKLTGGCTGQGCGAAFNFVAVLPNGEVHACRKFPSPIGNVLEDDLASIYDTELAARYRRGCEACDGCSIRRKCGGCLAFVTGQGMDPFTVRDPHCFMFD